MHAYIHTYIHTYIDIHTTTRIQTSPSAEGRALPGLGPEAARRPEAGDHIT